MTQTQTSPAIDALYRESVESHLEVYRAGADATRAQAKALRVANGDQALINETYRQMHEWEAQVRAVESIVGYVTEAMEAR